MVLQGEVKLYDVLTADEDAKLQFLTDVSGKSVRSPLKDLSKRMTGCGGTAVCMGLAYRKFRFLRKHSQMNKHIDFDIQSLHECCNGVNLLG